MFAAALLSWCTAVPRDTAGMYYLWHNEANQPNVGTVLNIKWQDIEKEDGKFDWSNLEKFMAGNMQASKRTWLSIVAGPAAPQWLYEGNPPLVPAVNVGLGSGQWCTTPINRSTVSANATFPYYLDKNYLSRWQRMVKTVVDHVGQKPWSDSIAHIGFGIGSTGDDTPWHGDPWDSKYCIDHAAWQKFWDSQSLWVAKTAKPLLDSTGARLDFGYVDEIVAQLGEVVGNTSLTLNAHERCKTYQQTDELSDLNANKSFVFAERSYGIQTTCWWDQYTSENQKGALADRCYWASLTWSLFSGVDSLVGPGCNVSTSACASMTGFFNKYAGASAPASAVAASEPAGSAVPGAWILLRVGLDGSDTDRFPEATFGQASQRNAERMTKIAQSFAKFGAANDDPKATTLSPQFSRRRMAGTV